MNTINYNTPVRSLKQSIKDNPVLEFETIRHRIEQIRGSWTADERSLRAKEGRRRRAELEQILLGGRRPKLAVFTPAPDESMRSTSCA